LRDATLLLFFVLNGVDHLAAFFHQREAQAVFFETVQGGAPVTDFSAFTE